MIVVLCVIGGAAGGGSQTAKTDSDKATTEATKATKPKKEKEKPKNAKKAIEALEGKTCYDAEVVLKKFKYTGEYTFKTTGMDYTGEVAAMDDNRLKEFTIVEVSDIDKSDKKASFVINSAANAEKSKKEKALQRKLSEGSSCVAIEAYGESEFPYGFKFSSFSATFTLKDDNTWHVSGTCEVTNGYGTEAEMQCIAEVTGTSDNPVVTYFEVR